ncbi:ComEC family competence protein [Candidatus Kaiserbacteria bacterium]|nr:ComEC family competence protein [Candidatus Kaiserbacteria bacterium]
MSAGSFYSALGGFGIGIFIASFVPVSQAVILWTLLLSLVLGVLWQRRYAAFFLYFSVFLLGCAVGLFRMDVTTWETSPYVGLENTTVSLVGIVVREPDVRSVSQHLYVQDEEHDALILITTDPFLDVAYGDRTLFHGVVERPESFETDLGRTFNYPGYLRARGVTHRISGAEVEVLGEGEGNPVIERLLLWKHSFMSSLERLLPEPEAGLGEGLLLGVKRALGEDLEEAFRKTGIIHIVVLSGYNIMIVVESIMRLLSYFTTPRTRVLFGGGAILSFALIVGLSATVVRASIMAALVLLARSMGRRYQVTRALLFSGAVMVLFNPYLLVFDPGFQLSFLATLGLILIAPHLEKVFIRVPTQLQIREFVVSTIATQIAVLPLLLYMMGEFSIVAPLVNVLVLPAVPLAMLLSFLSGVIGFVSAPLGMLFGFFAFGLLAYIVSVASWFGDLSLASFAVPTFPFWIVALCYVVMGAVLLKMKKASRDS